MYFDPVLVLNHPDGQFEQLQNDGHGLRFFQLGMAQGVRAQAVEQTVRRAGVKEAQVIGDKAVVGGAVTRQVVFDCLDVVLVLTTGAV